MEILPKTGSISNLKIHFNPDGWGPINGEKLQLFREVPYAHFDKKDKCGRPADFVQSGMINYQRPYYPKRRDDGNNDFSFKHDAAEDSTFQLVDTSKTQSRGRTGGRGQLRQQSGRAQNSRLAGTTRPGQQQNLNQQGRNAQSGRGNDGKQQGGKPHNRGNSNWRYRNKPDRVPSLSVGAEWKVLEEFDLVHMLKLAANVPKVEDLLWCGHIDQYDESYDKLTTRTCRGLRRSENKLFFDVTSSEDPILERLAAEQIGDVYATDAILAQLMAAPRSIYSWDIIVEKVNGLIFLDKREDSGSDLLSVAESANDPPIASDDVDVINHPDKLAVEATTIHQNFTQQILLDNVEGTRKSYEPNPFFDDREVDPEEKVEPASTAYRYRMFKLGDIKLVTRTELHAWVNKHGEEQLVSSHALHEWDSKYSNGVNWRQKIDLTRGAVLATELKNNSCRLAKWTAQALLAGANQMKLGYVSRTSPAVAHEHQILATQFFKPKDFAMQINLNVNNIWGIVKMICEMLKSKPDGKFVLLKDPNKGIVRLYSVPIASFERSDDEEEEEEEEGDDENDANGSADAIN